MKYLITILALNEIGESKVIKQRILDNQEAINLLRKVITSWKAITVESTADLMVFDILNKCDKGRPQGLENTFIGLKLIIQAHEEKAA